MEESSEVALRDRVVTAARRRRQTLSVRSNAATPQLRFFTMVRDALTPVPPFGDALPGLTIPEEIQPLTQDIFAVALRTIQSGYS